MKRPRNAEKLRRLVSVAGMGLAGAAVIQEMRKPASERTWHGRLWERVPYEFRPPTMARLREAFWAPDDPRIFTDTAFGVGWSVNLGHAMQALSGACARSRHTAGGTA